MKPHEFQKWLAKVPVTSAQRVNAWNLYKEQNSDAAHQFIQDLLEHTTAVHLKLRDVPVSYQIWGADYIEQGALDQMTNAARLPVALAGSLMPDAHPGYGLPIGGVLAADNAVIPYAVGVDIACRMKLTVYPLDPEVLRQSDSSDFARLQGALVSNTIFGAGRHGSHRGKIDHPVLDETLWSATKLTKSLRSTAIQQIGTSGTGNHFVEWGELHISDSENPLNLPMGDYLALLSHSGSRSVGFKIAGYYTELAMAQMTNLEPAVKHLAWLPLDKEAGQEYWDAMQLAGKFASANHQIIHERIGKAIELQPIAAVENHHNFAWNEKIFVNGVERDAIVHRKGATPAGKGVLGIIPGTMADVGYLVAGKGKAESLNSASHGSGRQMSRTEAFRTVKVDQHLEYLKQRGVTLIGGGLDESPQAYKPIEQVIAAQSDLVDIIGIFQPRIVRMASDR